MVIGRAGPARKDWRNPNESLCLGCVLDSGLRFQFGRRTLLEDNRCTWMYHLGELGSIPVRQPDATVRLRLTNFGGSRCAVNAVMLFQESNPNHADRTPRAWRKSRSRMLVLRVPE